MRCRRINKNLLSFYNNELTKTDKEKVKLHLETCSNCRGEYDVLINTINTINDLEDVELSPDFNSRLEEKIVALDREQIKKAGLISSLRSLWEYPLFSPERLWPEVAACVLAMLFISLIQFSWPIVNLDYPITKWPAARNFDLREISLNYNFLGISLQNRNGDISLRIHVGS
ncbi:zf-HC2 domain-containing protein [bacterium]|nr:zf-HC2 domain-containing protein [bacterium]